jgi:flagellar biosynthesis/type III secretory pathway M-ring protein FliF/YscJ
MDPDRQAVDEIKGDLERMLNESPESLAALLSTWMAK